MATPKPSRYPQHLPRGHATRHSATNDGHTRLGDADKLCLSVSPIARTLHPYPSESLVFPSKPGASPPCPNYPQRSAFLVKEACLR